jgi:glycosyltransferase involved in cell wall biosynthesis
MQSQAELDHYYIMARKDRATAALIIPALNEAAVIGATLKTVPPGLFTLIIVADNGSTDGTAEIAEQAGATVVREPERGYGVACQRALRAIPEGTGAVAFMQADGSEDPAEAAALLAPIFDGRADLVIGSRTLGELEPGALTPQQQWGNWLATTLIRWIYGRSFTDLGPFRAIRLSALNRLGMRDRNYGWTVEMQIRALKEGLRVLEVPVTYRRRLIGENKVSGNLINSVRAGMKIVWTVLRLAARSGRDA